MMARTQPDFVAETVTDTRYHNTVAGLVPVQPPGPADQLEPEGFGGHAAPLLRMRRGRLAGAIFALPPGTTSLGRHRDCDIVLDDATVSRQHTELRRFGDTVTVHDLGSLNGTYRNREPCQEATLADGDELWIGTFLFVFHDRSGTLEG